MTVLAERAAASPLLVGVARLWIAAIFLLVAAAVTARGVVVATGDRWRCLAMGACMAGLPGRVFHGRHARRYRRRGARRDLLGAAHDRGARALAARRAPSATRGRRARCLGVLGTALLVAAPAGALDLSPRFLVGVLLAFVAGLAYALYVLVAKATLRRSAPLPLTALTFTIGALLLTPALVVDCGPVDPARARLALALVSGGVATAAAYAIYTLGLRSVPASVAGVTTLLEPLTATILGVALFGERLGAAAGSWARYSW